ncbi:MAG: tRNA (cytidine(56)-2'-O)-methyltransferase, partial [Thermofilaceae archaeon]
MVESVHLEAGEEPIVVVLRVGHRPGRDKRISTHVGLVARAFGAQGVIFAGEIEETVIKSIQRVVETWGGPFFVKVVRSYREAINQWKEEGGIVVHLTMYGENIVGSNVLERIKRRGRKVMVVVGAEKVPAELYELADFNVAIGNQPHSEVGALAVFLDRFFGGAELLKEYLDAKIRIIP